MILAFNTVAIVRCFTSDSRGGGGGRNNLQIAV